MILVRHGQSHFNVHFARTRVDPGIVDPQLTEEGERQAREAGERLAACGIRRIVASPYWRTLHTAEIIAEALDLPVSIEPQVRERLVGARAAPVSRRTGAARSRPGRLLPVGAFAVRTVTLQRSRGTAGRWLVREVSG